MTIPNGPYLEFEKDVVELERKLQELLKTPGIDPADVASLERKKEDRLRKAYAKLTPWNKVELARRAGRPYTLDYIEHLFTDFVELHGDRNYADDHAIVGGFAKFHGRTVMIIGQQKGRDTNENVMRNFGMPHPEGYRKALRLMKLAAKFKRPIVTFIDTPGAFPGLGAEERGQGEAIARNLLEMSGFKVPIVSVVIGEGASGGALGIGVADRILMLENAWYSVISPEGCAAILWGDRAKAQELASKMKLTASELKDLGLVDQVVDEPVGGAHWDPLSVYKALDLVLKQSLEELVHVPGEMLVDQRLEKYSMMGEFLERA
jgi:acetyl-CoA carboxylase carboxyl transferase subunit alpha